MRGVISGIVPDGTYGQIAADDGQRYSYWSTEVRNGQARVGQTVEFQMWEAQPVDIFVVNDDAPPPNAAPPQRAAVPQQRSYASAAPAGRNAMPAGYAATMDEISGRALGRDYWIKLFTSPSGRSAG